MYRLKWLMCVVCSLELVSLLMWMVMLMCLVRRLSGWFLVISLICSVGWWCCSVIVIGVSMCLV